MYRIGKASIYHLLEHLWFLFHTQFEKWVDFLKEPNSTLVELGSTNTTLKVKSLLFRNLSWEAEKILTLWGALAKKLGYHLSYTRIPV